MYTLYDISDENTKRFTIKSIVSDKSLIHHKGQNSAIKSELREIFSKSTDPQPDPSGYLFFSCIIGKVKLLGDPLTPCIDGNKMIKESLDCIKPSTALYHTVVFNKIKCNAATEFHGAYYSLIGHWTITPNYYHWMMDVLPMIELMTDPVRKILIRTPRRAYERITLEQLGIWDRCVPYDGDHAHVDDFCFVSHPSWSVSYNPHSVAFLRNSFSHLMNPGYQSVKVYVSRKGSIREAYNEAEVEEYFRCKGWLVVDCSSICFQEQVDIFSRATDICGVHGAGLTNILWCRPDTRVIEIFADNWLVHSNENIALINGLKYISMILTGGWGGKVCVPIERLDQILNS